MRLVLLVGLMVGALAPAYGDSRADQLFDEGRKLLSKKSYARACEKFEASLEVEPAIGTLLNIGLCNEKLSRWPQAYRAYSRALDMARDADDNRLSVIRKHVERIGRKVARLAITIPDDADPDAEITLDGAPVDRSKLASGIVIEPGTHTLAVAVGDEQVSSKKLAVEAGAREQLALDVPRAKPAPVETPQVPPPHTFKPRPKKPAATATTAPTRSRGKLIGGTAMLGAGVVALGVATYVALDARADYRTAAADCPGGMCTTPEAQAATTDARDRARQMTYVYGAGIALVAVGSFLLVTSKRRPVAADKVSAAVVVTGQDALVTIGGPL